ncbi:serine/threonine protein kinase [Butyrivibrio sp. VCB2001]|uniref:serine/threonine protein kinase n=1 Tax=Butyrivibrio sp. VCB2001 TaxID=1280667 RepID=UPI00041AABD6|nr:serine/threonine-protein kinase [Butyrivibrio sp. VCB2001]
MNTGILYRGKYRIKRKLGEGGSSVVLMGIDEEKGRAVTIKQIKKDVYGAGDICSVIEEEVGLLKALSHPAIPKLIDVYDDAFVLEYVPGNSLEKFIKHKGFLGEKEAVSMGLELLDILSYLHDGKRPVVYRDLKPANIMVRPDGHVSLIDFGAARYYEGGAMSDTRNLGTGGFAAPEQYGNLGETDPRTDIYCFGRTLMQIMGGKCSPELMGIIDKCTRPDREDRYGSCREIRAALKKYPKVAARNKVMANARYVTVAAVLAMVISLGLTHYDTFVSYAAIDAQMRVPAVKERLGRAGIRIREILDEKYGDDIDWLKLPKEEEE